MSNASPIMRGLVGAMRDLGQRQRVIAENIANADTPGFKTKTVAEADLAGLMNLRSGPHVSRPSVTLTSGMASLGATAPAAGRVELDRQVSETKPDGNNVTLEDQLLKLGQVQADYATLTSLYAKQMKLLKIALGRSGQ